MTRQSARLSGIAKICDAWPMLSGSRSATIRKKCAMLDCKQSREEADALSLRGLMEVAKAWQRGDLYAQFWLMVYHVGRIAPSPIEARARMRAALAAEECAGEDPSTSGRQ
jgi:hypothetical protein